MDQLSWGDVGSEFHDKNYQITLTTDPVIGYTVQNRTNGIRIFVPMTAVVGVKYGSQ